MGSPSYVERRKGKWVEIRKPKKRSPGSRERSESSWKDSLPGFSEAGGDRRPSKDDRDGMIARARRRSSTSSSDSQEYRNRELSWSPPLEKSGPFRDSSPIRNGRSSRRGRPTRNDQPQRRNSNRDSHTDISRQKEEYLATINKLKNLLIQQGGFQGIPQDDHLDQSQNSGNLGQNGRRDENFGRHSQNDFHEHGQSYQRPLGNSVFEPAFASNEHDRPSARSPGSGPAGQFERPPFNHNQNQFEGQTGPRNQDLRMPGLGLNDQFERPPFNGLQNQPSDYDHRQNGPRYQDPRAPGPGHPIQSNNPFRPQEFDNNNPRRDPTQNGPGFDRNPNFRQNNPQNGQNFGPGNEYQANNSQNRRPNGTMNMSDDRFNIRGNRSNNPPRVEEFLGFSTLSDDEDDMDGEEVDRPTGYNDRNGSGNAHTSNARNNKQQGKKFPGMEPGMNHNHNMNQNRHMQNNNGNPGGMNNSAHANRQGPPAGPGRGAGFFRPPQQEQHHQPQQQRPNHNQHQHQQHQQHQRHQQGPTRMPMDDDEPGAAMPMFDLSESPFSDDE